MEQTQTAPSPSQFGVAVSAYAYAFAAGAAGLFGGVIGAIIFAIMVGLFEIEVRGRVMGILQSSFAASQILGLPIGLFLSNRWGWHSPFLMIVSIGAAVGVVIALRLKPADAHLKLQKKENPVVHLFKTLTKPRYALAFATTALLSIGPLVGKISDNFGAYRTFFGGTCIGLVMVFIYTITFRYPWLRYDGNFALFPPDDVCHSPHGR